MSGNSGKHSSKWDLREKLESKQLRPPWSSRDGQHHNGSKWSYLEEAGKISCENDTEFSSKANYNGSRSSRKVDIVNKDSHRIANVSMAWDKDSNYDTRISPGLEEWRHRSRSRSPKNICHRSVRSRSRSRSRSAERSYRRDMGSRDRTRSRSGASAQTCRDFVAGNCRRGSHCHFLHDGDKNYDNREARHRIDGASRYVHHGISHGLSQGADDELSRERGFNRRNLEKSFEQVRQEPGRSIDTPCKFFAAGHCRNGKYCRFSHDEQAFASPKGRSNDERRGCNRSDREQVWDLPRRSNTCSPQRGLKDDEHELGHDTVDVNKVWNGPAWDDVGAGLKATKMEDTSKTMDPPKSGSASWSVNDRWDHKLEANTKVLTEHTTESCKKESNHWEMQNDGTSMNLPDSRGADKWIGDVDMSPDWHYRLEPTNFVAKEEHAQSKSNLPGEVSYLATHDHDRTEALSVTAIVPDIPSSGNYVEGPHSKLGYVNEKGIIQPNVGKVHLLGEGQQLPQLYATLNSHDSNTATFGTTEGPFEPASTNTIKPDPTTEILKQHDPIRNRIETKTTDAFVMPSTSSPIGQKDVSAEKLKRPSLIPISDQVGDPCNFGNSDEQKDDKSEQMMKSQSVKHCETTTENNVAMVDSGKTVQDDNKREKENVTLENMERDGGTDDDKKIKDAKVIRAFKFALVEFVKELLKSTWKEGKITKEGYKTIVKKVVDKVTGSLQANHIPQTQEKIDQYLSFSKAKLNKLVQAYVEKVQKA